MLRSGRFPSPATATMPARFVTSLVLVALVLHGPAFAQQQQQQPANPAPRRKRAENRAPVRGSAGKTKTSARSRATAVAAPAKPAENARDQFRSIDWQQPPEVAGLGVFAEFRLPRGYHYTGTKGAKIFLEAARCPAPKDLLGILVPYGSYQWYVIYEWKEGVHKDDVKSKGQVKEKGKETGKPDADALLKTLRAANDADNAIRRTRGWAERTNLEWERPPAYDHSGNLTWALRYNSGGRRVIRPTTRIFGKRGAIDAHLVASANDVNRVESTLTNFLTLVEFTDGPNGGMRREDLGGGGSSSSGTTTAGATYVPTRTYTAGGAGARSMTRSPRTITGLITALTGGAGGAGAAFRRKRKSA